MRAFSTTVFVTCLASLAYARRHLGVRPSVPRVAIDQLDRPVTSRNGTVLPAYNTTYYFNQLIDHTNPSKGTFQQRYWHTYEFYESGGPIILFTPGEEAADGYTGYLTNTTINGLIAQQQSGSTIILEHRFFGLSNPYNNLDVSSLAVLTIQQAVDDLVYFAQNVQLPMPNGDALGPDKAPWILVGGSYSGALVSWTMNNQPGVFWAGYASSAVVQATLDYWQYFEPIRENMPANCSADVEAVLTHVDQVLNGTDQGAITALKNNWSLGTLRNLDDVAAACEENLFDWQSLQPDSGAGSRFTQFCDFLEVKNGVSAPAAGWGLTYALEAWGAYWNSTFLLDICGYEDPAICLGTYDSTDSYYTSTIVNNAARSWYWFVCNEVGYLQDGPPVGRPAIVSRLVQPIYDFRQCQYMFPGVFNGTDGPNVNKTNSVFGGWSVQQQRLFFANGRRDPWRDATISAENLTVASTSSQPIFVSDGFHCSDMIVGNAKVDSSIQSVQTQALSSMATWLAEWKSTATKREEKEELSRRVKSKPISAWFRGSSYA